MGEAFPWKWHGGEMKEVGRSSLFVTEYLEALRNGICHSMTQVVPSLLRATA
jgi:hypothetical protein